MAAGVGRARAKDPLSWRGERLTPLSLLTPPPPPQQQLASSYKRESLHSEVQASAECQHSVSSPKTFLDLGQGGVLSLVSDIIICPYTLMLVINPRGVN